MLHEIEDQSQTARDGKPEPRVLSAEKCRSIQGESLDSSRRYIPPLSVSSLLEVLRLQIVPSIIKIKVQRRWIKLRRWLFVYKLSDLSHKDWSPHIILVQSESNGAQVTWTEFVACRLLVEQPPVVRHCSKGKRLSDFSALNRRFTRSVSL